MSDAEPLLALQELMHRTFSHQQAPKVQPGGHPDEIFVDLSEDERDTLECSICYQILKDVRQCQNKHKFCYSCIFVWSTSGHPINHSRCPVCRVDGSYVRNYELDEIINEKKVKCSLKSCKWSGALKSLQSHQHSTYTNPTRVTQPANDEATELPAVTGDRISTELDRVYHTLASIRELERRRQEHLAEIWELGYQFFQAALKLRREIRTQMDHILESAADDQD